MNPKKILVVDDSDVITTLLKFGLEEEGFEIQAETRQSWVNQCKQNTSPSLIPVIEVVALDGKTVAIISVDDPIVVVASVIYIIQRYFMVLSNADLN
jgi:CheY-like chemotaxis protein